MITKKYVKDLSLGEKVVVDCSGSNSGGSNSGNGNSEQLTVITDITFSIDGGKLIAHLTTSDIIVNGASSGESKDVDICETISLAEALN